MSNWIISPDKYLTPEETRQLRRICEEAALAARARGVQAPVRDRLIIELAIGTGLRVSELANLRLEELYLKKGQNSLIVRNGKGGKDRVVQFNAMLKDLIVEYLNYRHSDSPYLFPSKHGEKITASGIQQVFKKWANKAGLPDRYSIHSLRHTYAVRLYKASGYNLRLVQKQLGHSSVSTTQVYADVLDADVDQALENLDGGEE
ncbi:tyrosine-type recombinase/integrase [Candidatus Neomarinimicrobiota bacterium]